MGLACMERTSTRVASTWESDCMIEHSLSESNRQEEYSSIRN